VISNPVGRWKYRTGRKAPTPKLYHYHKMILLGAYRTDMQLSRPVLRSAREVQLHRQSNFSFHMDRDGSWTSLFAIF